MASLNQDKFKVGDRVVFVENHPSDPFFPKCGATGTVVRTDGDGLPLIKWDKPNPNGWNKSCTHDSRLEKYVEPQKVVIWQDPHDMLRVVAKDTATGETGEARCHPDEQERFDFFIGAALALGRLFGHEPEITSVKPEEKMRPAPCKFKVGDKIIGNAKANRYGITREGWIGEVIEILDPPNEGFGCDEGIKRTFKARPVDGVGGPWPLAEDAFDLYEEPEEETVIHCNLEENARIIAMIMDFDAEGKVFDWYEQHIQHLSDWYEQQLRAQSERLEGKLVCIRSACIWWTEGKIYEAVNGVLHDDDGDATVSYRTLEELNSVAPSARQFAFLKE